MNTTKNKILELIILVIIILSITVIYKYAKTTIKEEPPISDTYTITNYSKTKTTKYSKNFTDSYIYNLPLKENIDPLTSTYTIHLTSTDNIINTLTEDIYINYLNIDETNKKDIINFCNAYDEIENKYRLQCKIIDNNMYLKNTYKINNIFKQKLKTKHYEINMPITNNTKLNDYLKILDEQNIPYYEESTK